MVIDAIAAGVLINDIFQFVENQNVNGLSVNTLLVERGFDLSLVAFLLIFLAYITHEAKKILFPG